MSGNFAGLRLALTASVSTTSLYHKKIVGTVEQYPDENAARRAVVGLVGNQHRCPANELRCNDGSSTL